MRKTCCVCERLLDSSNFTVHRRHKDGLQSQCVDCQRAHRRQHYKDNKDYYKKKSKKSRDVFRRWWRNLKSQYKCNVCDESHPACIDFHHADDNKEGNVSELAKKQSRKLLLAEIKKCIPLCSNCHRKHHYNERKRERCS